MESCFTLIIPIIWVDGSTINDLDMVFWEIIWRDGDFCHFGKKIRNMEEAYLSGSFSKVAFWPSRRITPVGKVGTETVPARTWNWNFFQFHYRHLMDPGTVFPSVPPYRNTKPCHNTLSPDRSIVPPVRFSKFSDFGQLLKFQNRSNSSGTGTILHAGHSSNQSNLIPFLRWRSF